MKQKKLEICVALIALAVVLLLTGSKLAQPERRHPEQDRFVGFQLCYVSAKPGRELDYTGWTVYGNEKLAVPGMGNVTAERRVLVGQYDEEADRYVFPGMEGLNCFIVPETDGEGETRYNFISDLADTKMNTNAEFVGDEFQERTRVRKLSGKALFGPPLDDRNWNTENFDYMWMVYEVYQMPDGTLYLTGSPADAYGGMGGYVITAEESYTAESGTPDVKQGARFEVALESVERITSVEVKVFDADDRLLSTRPLTMDEIGDGLTLELGKDAAWVLVAETDRNGRVERTSHSLDGLEEGASHTLIRLDDNGLGHEVRLELKR